MLVFWMVLAMALTDVIKTSLTIAQARGRAWTAASLDSALDAFSMIYTALGVHALDEGNTTRGITILAVAATGFVATGLATRYAGRLIKEDAE